jgi:hypothetical protein
MDLLTALRHELGHVLGLDHEDEGVMQETLAPGETRSVVPGAPQQTAPGGGSIRSAPFAPALWTITLRESHSCGFVEKWLRKAASRARIGPASRAAVRKRAEASVAAHRALPLGMDWGFR